MNILLLASHGIAEYDDVRMFSDLGFDVFCPGGYSDPAHPGETFRPAIPQAPNHPELRALCEIQRGKHPEPPARHIDWAKADLHPNLVDWADVIIVHHFVDVWIGEQWPRIRHKRVIWRTCGQSDPHLEREMTQYRHDGLQIVRYSPKEREAFTAMVAFAGEDAMIRFGKYPDDYGPWIGDGFLYAYGPGDVEARPWVGNVTQDMVGRGEACGLNFWLAATEGLPTRPAGPQSELLPGGIGALGYDEMREYLRRCRAYLYTGTYPASYTLGLIEALLTGTPVVSISARDFGTDLFEGDTLAFGGYSADRAKAILRNLLVSPEYARYVSRAQQKLAIETFGMNTVGPQWTAFLS